MKMYGECDVILKFTCQISWVKNVALIPNHAPPLLVSSQTHHGYSNQLVQPFIQAYIKESIKAPRYCPRWTESTGDR